MSDDAGQYIAATMQHSRGGRGCKAKPEQNILADTVYFRNTPQIIRSRSLQIIHCPAPLIDAQLPVNSA